MVNIIAIEHKQILKQHKALRSRSARYDRCTVADNRSFYALHHDGNVGIYMLEQLDARVNVDVPYRLQLGPSTFRSWEDDEIHLHSFVKHLIATKLATIFKIDLTAEPKRSREPGTIAGFISRSKVNKSFYTNYANKVCVVRAGRATTTQLIIPQTATRSRPTTTTPPVTITRTFAANESASAHIAVDESAARSVPRKVWARMDEPWMTLRYALQNPWEFCDKCSIRIGVGTINTQSPVTQPVGDNTGGALNQGMLGPKTLTANGYQQYAQCWSDILRGYSSAIDLGAGYMVWCIFVCLIKWNNRNFKVWGLEIAVRSLLYGPFIRPSVHLSV